MFYSIHNCDKHPEVPLMEIKYCTEKFLKDSGLPHITIQLCGFMQVRWTTFIALRNEQIIGKLLTFVGPLAWKTQEVNKKATSVEGDGGLEEVVDGGRDEWRGRSGR
ncbi:unnamed protein product [Linum trigynum]|uniref:Uncharacterized protein n=1 Tax=Linum trigynum TaxID=586398 RepID=A0AAV2EY66_9ROSI